MKFKIDENIPISVKNFLMDFDFDTRSVYEESLNGVKDKILLDTCIIEKRILITLDLGFSKSKESIGIIILRPSIQSLSIIKNIINLLVKVFRKREVEEHEIWIVDETRIRIRKKFN